MAFEGKRSLWVWGMGREGSVRGGSTEEVGSELGFKEKPWYTKAEQRQMAFQREERTCKNVENRKEKVCVQRKVNKQRHSSKSWCRGIMVEMSRKASWEQITVRLELNVSLANHGGNLICHIQVNMILKTLVFLLNHKFSEMMPQSFIKLPKRKPSEIMKLLLKSIAQRVTYRSPSSTPYSFLIVS